MLAAKPLFRYLNFELNLYSRAISFSKARRTEFFKAQHCEPTGGHSLKALRTDLCFVMNISVCINLNNVHVQKRLNMP